MRTKEGVSVDIWKNYNPRAYLLKLVQFEDDKRYQKIKLYPRKLIADTDSLTKKIWRFRFKNLIAKILI